ncbi:MAG: hypothetical protein EOP24_37465 [Hyphomicrobiales bacterium]|nr:MAG: hypothetical protein EOP24_37465 [Hyphomicrobiales bacterium]
MKITTNANDLRLLIFEADIFACRDKGQPAELGCILFERHENKLLAISTDRFRLGVTSIDVKYDRVPTDWSAMVHHRDLRSLLASVKAIGTPRTQRTCEVTIQQAKHQLTFGLPTLNSTFDVVQRDKFPDWRKIVTGNSYRAGTGSALVKPCFFGDFNKVVRTPGEDNALIETSAAPGGPTRITVGSHFVGLLMPVKDSPENNLAGVARADLGI